jgi:ABC-2 type transport system permease protein
MLELCKKEWQQFFGNITGYAVVAIFLLLNGLLLFVLPDTSILNFGYATVSTFFNYAPYILLFLIPAITMKSFAEEYKLGTFEVLKTLPITSNEIVLGKFFGCMAIVITALLPTIVYAISIQLLSTNAGMDIGSLIGSYIALLLLSAVYTAISLCCSCYTQNTVVAFIAAAFLCFVIYSGFDGISKLPGIKGSFDYFVESLGINFHYKNISKGAIDTRDFFYFILVIAFSIIVTQKKVANFVV